MLLRNLSLIRRFSTTRILRESLLSANYKSIDLWNERFKCPLLSSDDGSIKTINNKIVTGLDLTTSEIDIFINIVQPDAEDVAQFREALTYLKKLRRSIAAHTLLPATHQALCRLFLYSQNLDSLLNVLEDRINFGIFPDFFSMNLLLNEAIDKENFALASRLAVLVMLQEEFGTNPITDALSLYSVAKYIESKTDFMNWIALDPKADPILPTNTINTTDTTDKAEEEEEKKVDDGDDDDENEDEDEYVRIPFLRNEYFDNHFDLKDPRLLCGKTMSTLGRLYGPSNEIISKKCSLIGTILSGKWSEVADLCRSLKSQNFDLGQDKSVAIHYVQNLNNLTAPEDNLKEEIISLLNAMPDTSDVSLSSAAKSEFSRVQHLEQDDIKKLRQDFDDWSFHRKDYIRKAEEKRERDKLIEEVRAKKEELRQKEQYLYFFDNLRKKRLTRIDYI